MTGGAIRTFMIADVRGYTSYTQTYGDEAAGKLAAGFAEITREVVEGASGTLLELRGDEALSVFGSARDAIEAAVALQQRFVTETVRDADMPLLVGIGIDVGEAVPVEGGYRGGALNLAARLCSLAAPGEILASTITTHLAGRMEGIEYEDRGETRLKGMKEEVPVVRVCPVDDPISRLAGSPRSPRRCGLPSPTTRSCCVRASYVCSRSPGSPSPRRPGTPTSWSPLSASTRRTWW